MYTGFLDSKSDVIFRFQHLVLLSRIIHKLCEKQDTFIRINSGLNKMLVSKFVTVVLDCCAHANMQSEVKGNSVSIKLAEGQQDVVSSLNELCKACVKRYQVCVKC